MTNDALLQPTHRITFSRGNLTLVPWSSSLIGTYGPWNHLLPKGPSTVLADLTIMRDQIDGNEAVIREVNSPGDETFRTALLTWAGSLGYRRIWFPDALVELDRTPTAAVSASARCPVCRSNFSDSSYEFWLAVRNNGIFPPWCCCCGANTLPQWSLNEHP